MNTLVHILLLKCKGPQIVFNIEKLLKTICKFITIINLFKYTHTYLNKMYTKELTYLLTPDIGSVYTPL
jgi:hypothetical protein